MKVNKKLRKVNGRESKITSKDAQVVMASNKSSRKKTVEAVFNLDQTVVKKGNMEELKLKKNIWAGQKQYKDSKLKAKYEYKTFKMDIEKSDLESHK